MRIKVFDLKKDREEEVNAFLKDHNVLSKGVKFLNDSRTLTVLYMDEDERPEPGLKKEHILNIVDTAIDNIQNNIVSAEMEFRTYSSAYFTNKSPDIEKKMNQASANIDHAKRQLRLFWSFRREIEQEQYRFEEGMVVTDYETKPAPPVEGASEGKKQ